MPFIAASAAPCGAAAALQHSTIKRAAEYAITVFAASPGYLSTESLAAVLAQQQRPILWLRLEPEDRDPATLVIALIAAAQRLNPGIGEATLEAMRRHPGPLRGWPPLFAQLGHEFAQALPPATALVLERSSHLGGLRPTLRLFGIHLLPAIPSSMSCILIAHEPLSRTDLPAHAIHYDAGDLRLDDRAARDLADRLGASLANGSIRRAVSLADGRAVVLEGLFAASVGGGAELIEHSVKRASNMVDMLARIAEVWLDTAGLDERRALALALDLEYSHPDLAQTALGGGALPAGPWLQSLTDGWKRVRTVWQSPLRNVLRANASPERTALRRAADELARQGATERAIALYLAIGDTAAAGRAICEALGVIMDLGQWETLAGWLSQIPGHELHAWPWLIYARGEIALAQGATHAARDAFALASSLFRMKQDAEGLCQSLLTESSLAACHGEHVQARDRAYAALAIAETTGLSWHQGWATWHLGSLSADAGDVDAALAFYERAAAAADMAGDTIMAEVLRPTRQHALHQRDLRRQREFYRQAYFAAERAEHEAAEAQRQHHSAVPERVARLLGAYGWLRTPLALKLPTPPPTAAPPESNHTGLWRRLLGAIGMGRGAQRPIAASSDAHTWPSLEIPQPLTYAADTLLPARALLRAGPPEVGTATLLEDASTSSASRDLIAPRLEVADSSIPVMTVAPEEHGPSAVERAQLPTLTVHLLGQFRAILNDHPVEEWPSGRGRALFKYLLTHRERPVPRDVLMDVFWPDAEPEAARNSLNVTLHRLRQTLRAADDLPIVRFEDGAYRLNPDLQVWLDVEEFERHVLAGRRLEGAEQIPAAVAEYELAIGLYQGDFLEDDPYEEWPMLMRERLRVAYIDTLDRLSQIYFDQEQYATCIMVSQLLLARDNCREDAHGRLMRCYNRQGQRYLALRQYQICAEALQAELDVEPDPTTTQLYERIRQRERA